MKMHVEIRNIYQVRTLKISVFRWIFFFSLPKLEIVEKIGVRK